MNKTDLLLLMMEQPHQYTAEEWQEILLDDECRELYTLMSMTQSAVDAARSDKEVTDEMIDGEWQRLNEKAIVRSAEERLLPEGRKNSEKFATASPVAKSHSSLMKIAASFIGVLLVSGIAFAAIQIVKHTKQDTPKTEEVINTPKPANVTPTNTLTTDTIATPQPVIYDNVSLEKMLLEIAAHYDVNVTFVNDEARQLRFRFVWHPQKGINQVVNDLNQFERLTVTLNDNQITVK